MSKQTKRQREELRRAELQKFIKDCERLYEQNQGQQAAEIIPFPASKKKGGIEIKDRKTGHEIRAPCGMEMWITGYEIMDNSIHSTWKSQSAAFPRPANRVTHNSMIQPVIHITHNADYYGIQIIFSQNKICFYRKRL